MVKMASGGYSAGHGFQVRGAPRRADKVVRACGTWSVSSGRGNIPPLEGVVRSCGSPMVFFIEWGATLW